MGWGHSGLPTVGCCITEILMLSSCPRYFPPGSLVFSQHAVSGFTKVNCFQECACVSCFAPLPRGSPEAMVPRVCFATLAMINWLLKKSK